MEVEKGNFVVNPLALEFEAWSPVLAVLELDVGDSFSTQDEYVEKFIDLAASYANEKIYGSLSASFFAPPVVKPEVN